MPQTPTLSVRPTFTRAITDESIIPMAHLDRRPSVQSVRSDTSGHTSPDGMSRRESQPFAMAPPMVRTSSHYQDNHPVMEPPLESPVHTGVPTRSARMQAAILAPFQPRGAVFEGAAYVRPYWREGVFVATTVGLAVWLGVVTGRMRQIEDIPFCMVV